LEIEPTFSFVDVILNLHCPR